MAKALEVRSAAVIGAGVMGAAISAHLANAGIPTLLLDIKPKELTDEEESKGLDLDQPAVANRFAATGLERARNSKPASFFTKNGSRLVSVGNLDDDLEKLAAADWVIEAIIEDLAIKKNLYEKIVPHVKPDAVVTTNTSGLSVTALAESLPEELRSRFLVTHFFNPPRYLRLLEIVPTKYTDPAITSAVARLGEERLGKGIVHAKDTPNFIANRIGAYAMFHAVKLMLEERFTVAEVDKFTGKAIGRPKSAIFRTADLVGLDTLLHVVNNMYENLPEDPEREIYKPPKFIAGMLENGWLGSKSGQGFYKKVNGENGPTILMLDPAAMEYVEQPKVKYPSLEMAKAIDELPERLRSIVSGKDRASDFLWKNISATLRYAGACIPDVSDDLVNIDNALRWGFGWELGPFQIWDVLGVERTCKRMVADGDQPPEIATALLDSGGKSFYQRDEGRTSFFDFESGAPTEVEPHPKMLILSDLKESGKVILDSADASLIDLGDEVACLEFHTKMNAIGPGLIDMIHKSVDLVENDWRGLVLGNDADNFSVGANLHLVLMELDDDNWEDVEWMADRFQKATQRLRYSSKPVVAAPRGLALGGGCEIVLGTNRVCAAAETYIGLVELGAGVIPAGGGCKELIRRLHLSVPEGTTVDLFPLVRRIFEMVGTATVATSGDEAKEYGFFDRADRTVMNVDHLIHEAKQMVLAMDLTGFEPGRPLEDIRVVGAPGLAAIRAGLHNFAAAGQITDYDRVVGDKLAWVLCGGEVSGNARVSEQYILDLEREAFMSLCGEPKTLARMEHILRTGKPLRN